MLPGHVRGGRSHTGCRLFTGKELDCWRNVRRRARWTGIDAVRIVAEHAREAEVGGGDFEPVELRAEAARGVGSPHVQVVRATIDREVTADELVTLRGARRAVTSLRLTENRRRPVPDLSRGAARVDVLVA